MSRENTLAYNAMEDELFVMLDTGGYVTSRLKRLAELQAWLKTWLKHIAEFGSPQTGP
jgi:hypothetical protein